DAARHVPRSRDRSARGADPQPADDRDLLRRPGRPPRSVARHDRRNRRRMPLHADIELQLGPLDLAVQVRVQPGEVLAVLGPNGAGKSTLLRALAGLLSIDRGRITIDGVVLDDTEGDVFVPAERRPIGVVFQDYLLFAHLSALENVAFGLRARGV